MFGELREYLWSFVDKFLFWVGLVLLIGDLSEKFPEVKEFVEKRIKVPLAFSISRRSLFIYS
jgi:hypothetical protein